jgi:LPS export ABC transporter protein LptC
LIEKAMKTHILTIFLIIPLLAAISCRNDMSVIKKFIDEEIDPDLTGDNVEVLYSDSARLQMKMVTTFVKVFTSATEQRREFPEGLHVWFYEKTGELKAEITANWARHDIVTDIWEARNDVVITNNEGRKLETEQFFWEPKKGIVYSEKYTKITDANGQVATGTRFSANQDFTNAELIQGKATIILKDDDTNEN